MSTTPSRNLTDSQRVELELLPDRGLRAYLRSKAAALLTVDAGGTLTAIASPGLMTRRDPDTIGAWVRRYLAEGAAGLSVRKGRGRKPALSPLGGAGRPRGRG